MTKLDINIEEFEFRRASYAWLLFCQAPFLTAFVDLVWSFALGVPIAVLAIALHPAIKYMRKKHKWVIAVSVVYIVSGIIFGYVISNIANDNERNTFVFIYLVVVSGVHIGIVDTKWGDITNDLYSK